MLLTVFSKTVAPPCLIETERVVKMRSEYEAEVPDSVLERLKFLDEAGSNVAMTRLYGRAQPGPRVVESVPKTMARMFRCWQRQYGSHECADDDYRSGGWISFSRICQTSLMSEFGRRR